MNNIIFANKVATVIFLSMLHNAPTIKSISIVFTGKELLKRNS